MFNNLIGYNVDSAVSFLHTAGFTVIDIVSNDSDKQKVFNEQIVSNTLVKDNKVTLIVSSLLTKIKT